ncbi:hypothetical protein [Streptomyces canus]
MNAGRPIAHVTAEAGTHSIQKHSESEGRRVDVLRPGLVRVHR